MLPHHLQQKISLALKQNIQVQSNNVDEPQKRTVRFTPQQTQFLEALQQSLGGKASFNDAVSHLVNLGMQMNEDPFFAYHQAKWQIDDVFKFHIIPSIFINTLLKAIGIPEINGTKVNSKDALFQMLRPHIDKLAKFFNVSSAYLKGEKPFPYVMPYAQPFHHGLLEQMERDSITEFQPIYSLLKYTCPESVGIDTALYVKIEYQLDLYKSINVVKPIGLYAASDIEVIQYEEMAQTLRWRCFNFAIDLNTLNRFSMGTFLPEQPGRSLPCLSQ